MNSKVIIETHFTDIILFDVVGYSLLDDDKQYLTIFLINQKLKDILDVLGNQSFLRKEEMVLGVAPTGDGAYIILNHHIAGYGVFLAISLRTALLQLKDVANNLFSGLKTAVNLGTAIPIEDITGKQNFVGTGLNNCARLFSVEEDIINKQKHLKDDNYIIVSSSVLQWFKKLYCGDKFVDFLNTIEFSVGNEVTFFDKHKKEHKAYFIESSRKVAITPPKPKDIDKRLDDFIQDINKKLKKDSNVKK